MSDIIDFQRLSYLGERLRGGLATTHERDEYMLLLFRNGSISQKQYDDYLANGSKTNTEEIVNAALAVGAVVLIGYLISELFKEK